MMILPRSAWVVLAVLVAVEVAVLVPVIVTQKAKDEEVTRNVLVGQTKDFAKRVERTIATFMYNVIRAAAAAPKTGFLSEQALDEAIEPMEDPRNTPASLYLWIPSVSLAERPAYERFYGFHITKLVTVNMTVPYGPNEPTVFGDGFYLPYTVFVPPLPPAPETDPRIYGFDLRSTNTTSESFRNSSKYLLAPSSLVSRTANNYGIIAAVRNKYSKGYMFGRVGSGELLNFSLTVPRDRVTLAAYVVTAKGRQALFYDINPQIGNATTLALFDASPLRSEFVTANFSSFGETILVAMAFSEAHVAQYRRSTWVILAAVLAPVCFLIDVIWLTLALLWVRKKSLHELEQAKRKEAQVMICYVNHEIRNPLQTILGLADMQLERAEEEGDSMLAGDLNTIVRSAEFIEHIARDILDLRRVEDGKLEIEMSDVDVSTLVSGLRKAVVPLQLKFGKVDFKVIVDPELTEIHTDRYRLEQILLNFLSNAFKHTRQGTVTLTFTFTEKSFVRLAVADTGSGISDEMKENMFARFSQASASDAADLGGFGLGLYLTKNLAQLLGGSVGFESTLGVGSCFWVDLPMENDHTSLRMQFDNSEVRISNDLI